MRCSYCNKDKGPEDFSVFHELCKKPHIGPVETKDGIRAYFVPGLVCDECRLQKSLGAFYRDDLGEPFDVEGEDPMHSLAQPRSTRWVANRMHPYSPIECMNCGYRSTESLIDTVKIDADGEIKWTCPECGRGFYCGSLDEKLTARILAAKGANNGNP